MDTKSALLVAAFAIFSCILVGSSPVLAQANKRADISKAHFLEGSACNGTKWLALSLSGCAKPGSDVDGQSETRFEEHTAWLGPNGVCKTVKRKIEKCCYREKGEITIYQYAANYTYRCKVAPKKWDVKDKFEFQVPTASRIL